MPRGNTIQPGKAESTTAVASAQINFSGLPPGLQAGIRLMGQAKRRDWLVKLAVKDEDLELRYRSLLTVLQQMNIPTDIDSIRANTQLKTLLGELQYEFLLWKAAHPMQSNIQEDDSNDPE